jgi:hypothetical protein
MMYDIPRCLIFGLTTTHSLPPGFKRKKRHYSLRAKAASYIAPFSWPTPAMQ